MHSLITGGAGFIGSHLARRCLALGHQVTVVDNLSTGYQRNVPDGAEFVYCDLGAPAQYYKLRGLRPDVIYHLGAQSSGWISFDAPLRDMDDNLRSTVLLGEWAQSVGCPRVLLASTESTYGEGKGRVPFHETSDQRPLTYYGCSKLAAEHYLRVANDCHGLQATWLRLFSVYGPKQDLANLKQGILSIYLAYVLAGKPVTVKGSLQRVRDMVIVDDVVEAFLAAASEPNTINHAYNVCSGEGLTIGEIIQRLGKAFGHASYPVVEEGGTPGDVFASIGDHAALTAATGWKPTVFLDQGLAMIAANFKPKA